jgi:5'-3' exonuclease
MTIDGTAPQAKMNQQRSRRFRASKESQDKAELIEKIKHEIRNNGGLLPEDKIHKKKMNVLIRIVSDQVHHSWPN